MINLYEILGVKKNSTKEIIKKAYRKMSKSNHPDVGGNTEKFDTINKAYRILINDEKRKRYDNGENVDNILGSNENNKELSIIASIFCEIMGKADPNRINIIKEIKIVINKRIIDKSSNIYKLNNVVKKLNSFLKRLKNKNKNKNIMSSIANGQIIAINKTITLLDTEKLSLKKSLELLEDYDYDVVEHMDGFYMKL